jgi:hypothetical protein
VEGDSRECVGGHDVICSLFPRLSTPQGGHSPLKMINLQLATAAGPDEQSSNQRPLCLGVVLSGGQAPGGHNVIIGLHDYLQRWRPGSTLVGFLGGPRGVMQNQYKPLTAEELVGVGGGDEPRLGLRAACERATCSACCARQGPRGFALSVGRHKRFATACRMVTATRVVST